jgi:hypothetical protein
MKLAVVMMGLSLTLTAALAVQAARTDEPQKQAAPTAAQETQTRGYWVDPATGLMWAAKDNGKDVTWKQAVKYCRNLRLAGYSDWKLGSVEELQAIYDKNAKAPGLAGPRGDDPFTWHVKGVLFLTGDQWTATRETDDRGHLSGYAYRFDFNAGKAFGGDELYFRNFKRALCVRQP